MQFNNERLESYGDAIINMLVILELYLTKNKADAEENELDTIRKSRTANEHLMLANLSQEIYKHMMIEPQT